MEAVVACVRQREPIFYLTGPCILPRIPPFGIGTVFLYGVPDMLVSSKLKAPQLPEALQDALKMLIARKTSKCVLCSSLPKKSVLCSPLKTRVL